MSRTKLRNGPVTGIFGMAAAMFLLGTASLAQAQSGNATYWNNPGTAAWSSSANWTQSTFGGSGLWWNGGSVINNGGTATIAAGDNVTDGGGNGGGNGGSGQGNILIGGSAASLGGNGGSGYVTMTGGTLKNLGSTPLTEVLGVDTGSGIFTQTGGINVPYLSVPQGQDI